jgi:hypothetical protein
VLSSKGTVHFYASHPALVLPARVRRRLVFFAFS